MCLIHNTTASDGGQATSDTLNAVRGWRDSSGLGERAMAAGPGTPRIHDPPDGPQKRDDADRGDDREAHGDAGDFGGDGISQPEQSLPAGPDHPPVELAGTHLDPQWVGRTLRALREANGLSQSELARRTGSPRTYLIAIEQGKHEPSLEVLRRIAIACGRPLRDLIWYLAGEPFADPDAPLAARVRLRRERLGLRAADLARRAGTTRATISQIERGVNANPSLRLLTQLAAALHCCPSELAPDAAEARGTAISLAGEPQQTGQAG